MSPRLNALGQALMGVGEGPLSLDGVQLAPIGHCAQWLDDETAIFQTSINGRYVLATWRMNQGVQEIPNTSGCNELAAGGGQWLAWLAGRGLYGAITNANAGVSPTATDGRGAVGRDGTLAIVPDRQAGGRTDLMAPDGQVTEVIYGTTYGLQVLGPRQAIWNGGALGWMLVLLPGAIGVRVAVLGGGTWVV